MVRGQLLPENRHSVFHLIVYIPESFLPPLLPSLFFFSTALNMARWLESSLYGPWEWGGRPEKTVINRHDKMHPFATSATEWKWSTDIKWSISIHETRAHSHQREAQWTNKQKKLSLKNEQMKKWSLFPHFMLLSWHLPGIFPTAFSVLQVISGGMHGKNALICKHRKTSCPFLSLIKAQNSGLSWLFRSLLTAPHWVFGFFQSPKMHFWSLWGKVLRKRERF